jgi:hypothetical protein
LRSVNESGRLFAMYCKYVNSGRRVQILEYMDKVRRGVPIDFLALYVVHEISP